MWSEVFILMNDSGGAISDSFDVRLKIADGTNDARVIGRVYIKHGRVLLPNDDEIIFAADCFDISLLSKSADIGARNNRVDYHQRQDRDQFAGLRRSPRC